MFLPINKDDLAARGIETLDFIVVSGDAYVDHPSFGHALIARLIESQGFSVGIVCRPVSDADFCALGKPRLGFMVASGVVDSMVNNYAVSKKRRTVDEYAEGGKAGRRPDRAANEYCKRLKKLYPDVCVIAGGIEVSLRRLSHYDYWADTVMPSVLVSSCADLIVYGMGEQPLFDLLEYAGRGVPLSKIRNVRGTAFLTVHENAPKELVKILNGEQNDNYIVLPTHKTVAKDKAEYARAFVQASENTDFITGKTLVQEQTDGVFAVVNPPQKPLTQQQMDFVYALPFERAAHPSYKDGVPALNEVEFSITGHRGCFGNCSFCALTYHQGRCIQNRSKESIVEEAKMLSGKPNFKGYIHDIGGPSANFRNPSCEKQKTMGICKNKDCIGFKPCSNLKVDHSDYLDILRTVRSLPGIKKVFIRSGVRFDYAMMDSDPQFLNELIKHHTSGQIKVAPEHISDKVLKIMNKPPHPVYEKFCVKFAERTEKYGLDQYIVPYFISSHPGCNLSDAVELSVYLHKINYMPKQVQDFYPTPGTLATTMYYTGLDPRTMQQVFSAKSAEEKAMQRALLQYRLKSNYWLVKAALEKAGRADLIGYSKSCLIRPPLKDNPYVSKTVKTKK